MSYEIGDTVILKSHEGPVMVVRNVRSDDVECFWFTVNDELHREYLHQDMIEAVEVEPHLSQMEQGDS